MEKYYAAEDRNRRLNNTVCLYKDAPVFVKTTDPNGEIILAEEEVFICPVEKVLQDAKGWVKIKYTEKEFCAKAPTLGYMNHKNGTSYLVRHPNQQQKQGICGSVVTSLGPTELPRNWIYSKNLSDCIKGVYPSYEDAFAKMKDTGYPVAFDRMLAVAPFYRTTYQLVFRGRPAGTINSKGMVSLNAGKEERLLRALLSSKGVYVNASTNYS